MPPPEDQRDYEQWRQYIASLDAQESAQASRRLQNRFFLMLVASVVALAVILGQLATLFGFSGLYVDMLLKLAFGTLAVAAVVLIYATWLEWRISIDRALSRERAFTLQKQLDDLNSRALKRTSNIG